MKIPACSSVIGRFSFMYCIEGLSVMFEMSRFFFNSCICLRCHVRVFRAFNLIHCDLVDYLSRLSTCSGFNCFSPHRVMAQR